MPPFKAAMFRVEAACCFDQHFEASVWKSSAVMWHGPRLSSGIPQIPMPKTAEGTANRAAKRNSRQQAIVRVALKLLRVTA
jgi:hypothetical protein